MSPVIFLSPHLDDAALSCGAYISMLVEQSVDVRVYTVFSGIPKTEDLSQLAKAIHLEGGLESDAMLRRREEDRVAMQYLGVNFTYIDLLDCIYRTGPAGRSRYQTKKDIFAVSPHLEVDADTLKDLVTYLCRMLKELQPSEVYVPLGIGNHIDHILVREALERSIVELGSDNSSDIIYYEDVPYICSYDSDDFLITLSKSFAPKLQSVSDRAWTSKLEAIAAYKSQVSTMWDSPIAMRKQISDYSLSLQQGQFTERFWKPRASPQ
ncbi:MAG: PIG-L family deacetylase [Cyanobacteriota bacterium]|nr:PIG-L family deacetylase [Cyanobacteriota bacterium]